MKAQVISCIFGVEFNLVHPAFAGRICTLFSNNPKLEEEAVSKGWNFRYVKKHPLSSNSRISSIQSKYIKFLQFYEEFSDFSVSDPLFYADHKFMLDPVKLELMEDNFLESSFSLFLPSGRERSIIEEVKVASDFQRYKETMPQTVAWLHNLANQNRCKLDEDVKCTTFIYYKNPEKVKSLLDEVYRVTWDIAQPECQIIFGALCQAYPEDVFSITWKDIGGSRFLPE